MSSTGNTQAISENVDSPTFAPVCVTDDDIEIQKGKDWPGVEPSHKAFAYEYVSNGYNHSDAAEKVGLPRSSGLRIRRLPLVTAFIAWIQEAKFQTTIITKEFIECKLDDLYDMAIGEVDVPCVTGSGETFSAPKFQGGLALQILQERSKMNGITKQEEKDNSGVTVVISMENAIGAPVTIEGKCSDA